MAAMLSRPQCVNGVDSLGVSKGNAPGIPPHLHVLMLHTHRGYPAKRALSAMRKPGMASRALLAGYPRHTPVSTVSQTSQI